jgi:twitching motility protein PilI
MIENHLHTDVFNHLKEIQHRSQKSAAKLSENDIHGSWTAIGFRIAEHHLLIPLNETREVFTVPEQITAIPKSKPWVYGIANLRGELLPLFDLKFFLFGKETKVNKRSRIVVNNHPSLYSGLLLDEVFGLKHFQNEPDTTGIIPDSNIANYVSGHIVQKEMYSVSTNSQLIHDF